MKYTAGLILVLKIATIYSKCMSGIFCNFTFVREAGIVLQKGLFP